MSNFIRSNFKPVRFAVVFDQHIRAGGGYQQALNAVLLVKEVQKDFVSVVLIALHRENIEILASTGAEVVFLNYHLLLRAFNFFRSLIPHGRSLKAIDKAGFRNPLEAFLGKHGIDLVYFVSPCGWAAHLEETNYITTVWDLSHRDHPEFPEVRSKGELKARDRKYRSILPGAVGILVDSEISKCNIQRRYGVDADRVHVMPFEASIATRRNGHAKTASADSVRERYQLDVPYIFYPAQFWPHKNHIYILEGLKFLEKAHGVRIGAIFSGGDMGNLKYIEKCVEEYGLGERVRFAGFVSNEEIPQLYQESVALVMPSYFGPTNLPPLEAFELGVPVLYSDLTGMRDQVGDAALLLDLKDPGSMAAHLAALIASESLRDKLIEAGRERLREFRKADRVGILRAIIEEFRVKRSCWK